MKIILFFIAIMLFIVAMGITPVSIVMGWIGNDYYLFESDGFAQWVSILISSTALCASTFALALNIKD